MYRVSDICRWAEGFGERCSGIGRQNVYRYWWWCYIAICVTWYWSKTVLTNQKTLKLNSLLSFRLERQRREREEEEESCVYMAKMLFAADGSGGGWCGVLPLPFPYCSKAKSIVAVLPERQLVFLKYQEKKASQLAKLFSFFFSFSRFSFSLLIS